MSLPMRGEWIEMYNTRVLFPLVRSLPMRGEWIEIVKSCNKYETLKSLPMRGEWIEIVFYIYAKVRKKVSPHAGRVD